MRLSAGFFLFFIAFVVIDANTCGGNCPSGDCATCPCGTTPNQQPIATWCAKFSSWDQSCCQCIMRAESSGNANAVQENSGGSYDVGLWQIDTINWSSCSSGTAPCDPATNLQCAITVWKNGGNTFREWATCGKCGCCGSTTSTTHAATTSTRSTQTTQSSSSSHSSSSSSSSSHSSSSSSSHSSSSSSSGSSGSSHSSSGSSGSSSSSGDAADDLLAHRHRHRHVRNPRSSPN